jgi:lipopolysaccharide export system protein LptA
MTKKKSCYIFFATVLFFSFGIGWAAGQLEVKAPLGGDFDLLQNIMNYHGTNSQLVEAHWKDSLLENDELHGKESKNVKKASVSRVLKSIDLTVNLGRDYLMANKKVTLVYDESTSATCDSLEWDRQGAFMKLFGQVVIKYQDWIIKGSRVEGQLDKDLFTVYGPVEASNPMNIIRGGKLVLDRVSKKAIISDNALIIRDKSEMSAPEITYFFDTKQVLASGTVKTRIINETK